MRKILVALLVLGTLTACTSTKYTETPKATGEWMQANPDPDSTSNDIVPLPGDSL